jgi:hypothetical protein
MAFTDMKMTRKQLDKQYMETPVESNKNEKVYPNNLLICLFQEQLDKLGIDITELNLDDKGEIRAKFCVVGTKDEKGASWGSPKELKIQLEKLEITFSDDADDDLDWETDSKKAEGVLQKRGILS